MLIERTDGNHYSELLIYPGERHPMMRYTVVCMGADIVDDQRAEPTARISLLSVTSADPDTVFRLAAEYAFVAGAAAALQSEKRAKYAVMYPTEVTPNEANIRHSRHGDPRTDRAMHLR